MARGGRVRGIEAPGEAAADGEREDGCSAGTEEEDRCSGSEQDKRDWQAARYPSVRERERKRERVPCSVKIFMTDAHVAYENFLHF